MPRQLLKKRKDGRYVCRYKDQYFYAEKPEDALAARIKYIEECNNGSSAPAAITVGEYAAYWLPVHKANVAIKTYNDYAKQINVLIEKLGGYQLSSITPSQIKEVYTHYIGYSASTIKRARMLYIAIWDTAIEDGYTNSNPAKNKKALPHKGTVGSHRALTPEEDKIIIDTPADFRLAVLVMRYAGLRRGEVLSLNIDKDVDFRRKVIRVHEAIRFKGNQPVKTTPKTEAGIREVPLFEILENELKDHHGLVAPSAKGKTMSESAFKSAWDKYINCIETRLNGCHKRWYGHTKQHKKMLEQDEKLPDWIPFKIRPHDLRHSYCTMLRDAGVEMKLAMRWMGHADEKMILRIYDHITEDRIENAISEVEEMIKVK